MPGISFLTNHGLVLLCIAEEPTSRMRDIAVSVDITERAAQRLVADLIDAGYVQRTRAGRRNTYSVRGDLPVPVTSERVVELDALLAVLLPHRAGGPRCRGDTPAAA